MRYLNSFELTQFHEAFLAMCVKHASTKGEKTWGFPGGINDCDTYSFGTQNGNLYVGHSATIVENRWWIPINLLSQTVPEELTIAFEMNIPKERNISLSVHYVIDDDNRIRILHKGRVTARAGLRMADFFNFYRKNPGIWPVFDFSNHQYLEFGKVSLPMTDDEFLRLLESLAAFATYITEFKNNYR